MAIKLTIHKIDQNMKTAVITLIDNDHVWVYMNAIELELNSDGTANTKWLTHWAKLHICRFRLSYIDKIEKDLV